jgi:hypothetical protein
VRELQDAEDKRERYETVYREATRAYRQECGFTLDIGLTDDLIFFGDYEILVDLCRGCTCIDRTTKFVEEYTEWVQVGQFEEKTGCGTNIFGGQMADNYSVQVRYFGPKPSIRAFHLLSALVEIMDDPYKQMEFTEGVVIPGVDEATGKNVLFKMREIYGYIEDSWWKKETWTGSRVEVEFGSRSTNGRGNYSMSEIVRRELNEIEFELGNFGVFPKLLKLRDYIVHCEITHFLEDNRIPLELPQLAEQA